MASIAIEVLTSSLELNVGADVERSEVALFKVHGPYGDICGSVVGFWAWEWVWGWGGFRDGSSWGDGGEETDGDGRDHSLHFFWGFDSWKVDWGSALNCGYTDDDDANSCASRLEMLLTIKKPILMRIWPTYIDMPFGKPSSTPAIEGKWTKLSERGNDA